MLQLVDLLFCIASASRALWQHGLAGNKYVPHARRQNCAEALWPNSAPPAPMVLRGEQQETMSLLKMEQGQWTNELELSD